LGGAFGEGPLVALRQALSSDPKYICGAGYAHMAQRLDYGSCSAAGGEQMIGRGMAEIDHALTQNHAPGWPIRQLEHVAFNCILTLRPESSLSILGL
jgi:hypothetical protein